MLERKRISNSVELKIVTASIHDTEFLLDFQNIYKPGSFSDVKFDKILRWCITYLEQYDECPGYHIFDLFNKDAEFLPEEEAEMTERVLKKAQTLQDRGLNKKFLLDKAKELFQKKALETLGKVIEGSDVEEALRSVEEFSVPENKDVYITPFTNVSLFTDAIEKRAEPIFTIKGALGEMMNPYLTRDSFIGILAPEKRGKTWWCFYLALRALICRNNVALFQVGDMSEDQGLRRIGMQVCHKPIHEYQLGKCLSPVIDCRKNQNGSCSSVKRPSTSVLTDESEEKPEWNDAPTDYIPCSVCRNKGVPFPEETWFEELLLKETLNTPDLEDVTAKLNNRAKGKEFRMSTHPNSSINVTEIHRILKRWKRSGWVPDVIVIDYADILAPEPGTTREFRLQENEKWKALRRLSQVWNCCLITPTQANASSYDGKDLDLSNFSESKTKYAHATAFYGINENEQDKLDMCQRIVTLLLREGEFSKTRQVRVLQNRRIGQVHLDSYWTTTYSS